MDVVNKQLQVKAYQWIKQQILSQKLNPGEFIDDSQFAKDMGVSRTPVREALSRLEKEGLVVYSPRKGWCVYSLNVHDVEEIFALKEVVEGLLARQAASNTDVELRDRLQSALTSMRQFGEIGDWPHFLESDFNFHETIYAMSRNQRATNFARQLNEQWHRLRINFMLRESRMVKTVPEHERIAESILQGDGAAAETWMRSHMKTVRDELMDLLVNLVYPFVPAGL